MQGLGDRLRVVQYNVRRLLSDAGRSTFPLVADSLRALQPALVTLNEVDIGASPECVAELAAALNLRHHRFFGHARQGRYGNAILSAFPLETCRLVHLDGGTVVKFAAHDGTEVTKRIGRGAILADLIVSGTMAGGGTQELSVVCTHLDHMEEDERMTQTSHILRELRSKTGTDSSGAAALLCGDLNATRRSDYVPAEWQALNALNHSNGWRPPRDTEAQGGCIHNLEDAGFVDTWRRVHGHRSDDEEARLWTAHVDQPRYRIDYVFANEAALGIFDVVDAFVDTTSKGSDHFPLVVDLQAKRQASDDAGQSNPKL